MSLQLHFASLSLSASVDQQTGSLSVFDIVEELRVPQLPIHLHSLVISLALEKQEAFEFLGKIVIHILTPDGKQASIGNGELRIPPEQKRMKAVFRFGNFPVLQFGEHRFVVSWLNGSGTKIGEALLDFDVIQVTPPIQASPQGAPGSGNREKPSITH